jgi:hypothetical protein
MISYETDEIFDDQQKCIQKNGRRQIWNRKEYESDYFTAQKLKWVLNKQTPLIKLDT